MTRAGVGREVGKGSDAALQSVRRRLRGRRASHRPVLHSLFLLLFVLGSGMVAPGCATRRMADALAPLPPWIVQLVPGPGANSEGIQEVEVQHRIVTPEYIRLIIDGVDVTAYADKGPDLLHYDARIGPVALEPGVHTGKVDRMKPANGSGPDIVVDSYRWSFRIT